MGSEGGDAEARRSLSDLESAPTASPDPHQPSDRTNVGAMTRSVGTLERADTALGGDADASGLPPIETGAVLGGRYEVLAELGRGGEGVVYRARDRRADAIVALKLLSTGIGSATRLLKFRRELRMARKVTHPSVVRIHDLVELPGRFGLSMELVEGMTLAEKLAKDGPLPAAALVALADDLAQGLAAAHSAGITHRDLKPSNVILDAETGRAKITDFGVSRLHGDRDATLSQSSTGEAPSQGLKLTAEGAIIGTPHYMAPEQLLGRIDIGPPADVYAFGLVVREAATGTVLHDARTLDELRAARMRGPAPPLGAERTDLPSGFAAVVDRCLERDVVARYASGKEILRALGAATAAAPRRRGARPLVVLLVAAAVVAGGSAALWIGVPRRTATPVPSAVAVAPRPPFELHANRAAGRITYGEGCEESPSFTPDSRTIVFGGTVGSEDRIFSMPAAGGTPRELTHAHDSLGDVNPRVSPDGRLIAFRRRLATASGVFVMDVEGIGAPRRVADGTYPFWTRDGRGIWAKRGRHLVRVDAETGSDLASLDVPEDAVAASGTELDDGSLVVAFPLYRDAHVSGIGAYSPTAAFRWLLKDFVANALAVAPDKRHLLIERYEEGGALDPALAALPLDGSAPTSLDGEHIAARRGIAVAPDGKSIVWSTCKAVSDLVRYDWVKGPAPVWPSVSWDDHAVAAVPGTSLLVTASQRDNFARAWVVDPDGGALPRVLSGLDDIANPVVSPDGKHVAAQANSRGIWAATIDGTEPARSLTEDANDSSPTFTGDSRRVLFARTKEGVTQVLSVPLAGGDPSVLIPRGRAPVAVPNGDRVVYLAGDDDRHLTLTWFDPATSASVPVTKEIGPDDYRTIRISPDGRRLAASIGGLQLVEIALASGHVLHRVRLDDQIDSLDYYRNGLIAIRDRFVGDLWSAEIAPAAR
jgi:Tol biopolymer transport system component